MFTILKNNFMLYGFYQQCFWIHCKHNPLVDNEELMEYLRGRIDFRVYRKIFGED